jgi:hypothetical protein
MPLWLMNTVGFAPGRGVVGGPVTGAGDAFATIAPSSRQSLP